MPTQVDYDPFAAKSPSASAGGTPVDHDPFANKPETKKMGWWEGLGYEFAGVGIAAVDGLAEVVKAAGISPFEERGDIGGDIGTAVAHPIKTAGKAIAATPKTLQHMFTEPKTPEEALDFGSSWVNVLGGLKGAAELYSGGTSVLKGIKDAKNADQLKLVESQANEVRQKAKDTFAKKQEETQSKLVDRKKAIADEHSRRIKELREGTGQAPVTTVKEQGAPVSAKEVEAQAKVDREIHEKEIAAEYKRRQDAIRDEIHRAHVEAEEAAHAELREAQIDAEKSIAEANKNEKLALKDVRGEAAQRIRAARAEYQKHKKKIASQAEAASELPASDIGNDSPKGTLGRDMRARWLNGFRAALRNKRIGSEEFKKYIDRGRKLENEGNSFISSESGSTFVGYLRNIQQPPPGAKVTKFSVEFRNAAKRLENNLRGQVPVGADDVLTAPLPLSIDAIDEELRNLRALENRTDLAGSDAIQRGRAANLANNLESAMIAWVGEEHYPRAYYAEMSKDFNKFQRPLFKDAVGRVELDYHKPNQSPFKTTSKDLEDKTFGSAENVREARAFIGDQELDQFASRYVSNELYGKDAKAALSWWEKARKNGWIKETPEINNMTRRYVETLAQQEGDLVTLKALKESEKAALEEAQKTIAKVADKAIEARVKAETEANKQLASQQKLILKTKETTQDLAQRTAAEQYKQAYSEREQNLEHAASNMESRVSEAKKLEDAARKQLEKSQRIMTRQEAAAAISRGDPVGKARKVAVEQYKNALKEAETATKTAEAELAKVNVVADAMYNLLAGERPATALAKFETAIEPKLREAGISDQEIQRFKNDALSLDKAADKIARNKKIKRFFVGVGTILVGSELYNKAKKLVP